MTNQNSPIAKLVRTLLPYQLVPYWATPAPMTPPDTVTILFRLDSDRPVFDCECTATRVFVPRLASTKGQRDV